MEVSPRIAANVAREYGTKAPQVEGLLRSVPREGGSQEGSERICAAILIVGHGDMDRLMHASALAAEDWRDVLVLADLASEDWRDWLEAWLAGEGRT